MNPTRLTILSGLLALALGLFCQSAPAAPSAIKNPGYRGSDEVLADTPAGPVTERDLLIFALETGLLDPVALVNWRDLESEGKNRLREALRNFIKAREFASRYTGSEEPMDVLVRVRAERLNAAPIARVIWADKVVRDTVVIFPEDIFIYYLSNPDLYSAASAVRILQLRVPIESPVTPEGVNNARRVAEDLRLQAIREGGLAGVLAAHPQYLVDPAGETLEITRDSPEANTPVAESAFQLGLAQISEPIQTRAGFFVIEVEEKTRPMPEPLEKVRESIITELRNRFIPQQFDYLSGKELVRSHATNRAWLFQFLPDDADILSVRDFSLSTGDFKRLYPEVVGLPSNPNKALIRLTAQEIISGEIATQDLESRGLIKDPFYEQAREIGSMLFMSTEYVRSRKAELNPTAEEVQQYLDQNPEQVYPSVSKVVWKYEMAPRDPESLRPGELDSLQILMRSYLENLVLLARQQLSERRELLASSTLDPEAIVRNLPEPDDKRVRVRLQRLGTFNKRQSAPELAATFSELTVGEFTDPRAVRDGTVVSYFVSQEVQSPPPTRLALLEMARQALTVSLIEQDVTATLHEWELSGKLKFNPSLNPAPVSSR